MILAYIPSQSHSSHSFHSLYQMMWNYSTSKCFPLQHLDLLCMIILCYLSFVHVPWPSIKEPCQERELQVWLRSSMYLQNVTPRKYVKWTCSSPCLWQCVAKMWGTFWIRESKVKLNIYIWYISRWLNSLVIKHLIATADWGVFSIWKAFICWFQEEIKKEKIYIFKYKKCYAYLEKYSPCQK